MDAKRNTKINLTAMSFSAKFRLIENNSVNVRSEFRDRQTFSSAGFSKSRK